MLTRIAVVLSSLAAACSSPARPPVEPVRQDPPTDPTGPMKPDGTLPLGQTDQADKVDPADQPVSAAAVADAKAKLGAKYGATHKERIERGVSQVAALWRQSDGDLAEFVVDQFAADQKDRDALFAKLEATFEQLEGHILEAGRTVRWGTEVESGPMLPIDRLLAGYDPGAHVIEDLFTSKVAFSALLNFPLTKLADRIRDGASYSRRQWAEVRLTGRFDTRVPGSVALAATAAEVAADQYIAGYNLWMHHVLGEDGSRKFPAKKRLITHWNLRDELKANYADKTDGLVKQRTIAKLMERIVTQQIPKAVIDNPRLDWDPFSNKVTAAPANTVEADAPADRATQPSAEREPDARFERVRQHFVTSRQVDAFSPIAPTRILRAFENAEVPEDRVRSLLLAILESPLTAEAAKEMEQKLGRKPEPHDLWYEFGGGETPETELDGITRKKYPTAAAFAKDLPRILRDLGFSAARAKYLSEHIAVDPSRGAGHAMDPGRRGDKAHLRTRVEPGGMDYKGYNIAVHELGHNVEQVFSLYNVDHTLLKGVPNTAFTEALAFLFQARDLALLGRPKPKGEADRLKTLDEFWNTREIAGSALVEIEVWHWLYKNPNATATEIRDATLKIARETWDKFYAPYLGGKGTVLLGIYSHTITSPLYLFNYVLGHLIAFQVEELVHGKDKVTFAKEFERVSRQGAILPDLWMQGATGKPVSADPMLTATAKALKK